MRLLLILIAAAFTSSSFAAQKYIRSGASGANNGNNWTDAYTSMPTFVRGTTNYIAAGSYGDWTFNVAYSGATYCTLQKATIADHGTDTGWDDSYAATNALFTYILIGTGLTGNLLIDGGQTNYGIKVKFGVGENGIEVAYFGSGVISNIWLHKVESAGPAGSTPFFYQVGDNCCPFYAATFSGGSFDDFHIDDCYFHGADTLLQTATTKRMLVERTVFSDSITSNNDPASPHPNVWFLQTGTDTTFRYNTVTNWQVTGFYPNGTSPGTHRIYGNYFENGIDVAGAVWFFGTITSGNGVWLINNNTFRNMDSNPIHIDAGAAPTGGVTNNIFYNCGSMTFGANLAHNYNLYSGSSRQGEPNGIAAGNTNIFSGLSSAITNTIGGNFPRNKGATLSATFALGINGVTRGLDGTWDIGAYEYESLKVSPQNLVISNQSTAVQFYATNSVGGGVLSNVTAYSTWTSLQPTVASINSTSGLANVTGLGVTTISATWSNLNASARLERPAPVFPIIDKVLAIQGGWFASDSDHFAVTFITRNSAPTINTLEMRNECITYNGNTVGYSLIESEPYTNFPAEYLPYTYHPPQGTNAIPPDPDGYSMSQFRVVARFPDGNAIATPWFQLGSCFSGLWIPPWVGASNYFYQAQPQGLMGGTMIVTQ